MARLSSAAHAAVLSGTAAALFVVSGCGNHAASGESSAGSAGSDLAGSFGGSGKSGASGGAAATTQGGTSSIGGEENAAGDSSAVNAASGATSHPAGGASAAGGAPATREPPPGPARGGGSVYAVECSGETAMCGVERSHCLGINLDQGGVGYACSNRCDTVGDCSDAPSGAAAQVDCVQFTKEKRCVLVCYDQPNEYACPGGMSCYIYPNSPIGYCLWTK